jgi:crotonobetainyl-CoA:carnitine CoA-transferase CaiB-like acyl-CoA transferase
VGEHTRAVLGDLLGYSAERVEALHSAGVIGVVSGASPSTR